MADNVSPNSTKRLLKSVRHLLVDLDLTGIGYIAPLAAALSALLNKQISRVSLNMALSGYRTSAPYQQYLNTLQQYLRFCKARKLDPVTAYTKYNPISKPKKKEKYHGR